MKKEREIIDKIIDMTSDTNNIYLKAYCDALKWVLEYEEKSR